jgi:hypothetical protein
MASCRGRYRGGHIPQYRGWGSTPGLQARDRSQQTLGIGMGRMLEDCRSLPILDNTAKIHDGHGMSQILDDAKVTRNEEIGKLLACLEVVEQIENLHLGTDTTCICGAMPPLISRKGGMRNPNIDTGRVILGLTP